MSSTPPRRILGSYRKKVPETEDPSHTKVRVFHPFHNEIFLTLPVRRCPLPGDAVSADACIPLTALLDACQILTGETGVIARDDAGEQVVSSDLVYDGHYYYIINDNPHEDYPIFHSFDDWVPPRREDVPDRWFTSVYPRVRPVGRPPSRPWDQVTAGTAETLLSKARGYDERCRLSGYELATDACHVVPASYDYWFFGRNVVGHLCDPYPIPDSLAGYNRVHDIRNLLTMRKDIHSRWDDHAFAYIPVDGQFVAFWMSRLPEYHVSEFHCCELDTPPRLDGYLMYIRFGLAIFSYAGSYVWIRPHPKSLRLMKPLPTTATAGQHNRPTASGPKEVDEVDPNDLWDGATAAQHIIGWSCSDVDGPTLRDDLTGAWAEYIPEDPEVDVERLRNEWQERQRGLGEKGLHPDNALQIM